MNWTSTKAPLWQIDCDEFRNRKKPFELRDVTTEEHEKFTLVYASRFDLGYKRTGSTVLFSPRRGKQVAGTSES